MSDTCPSCGVEYVDHLGLIGTCRRLQDAISTVGELEDQLADLRERYECKGDALNSALLTIDALRETLEEFVEAIDLTRQYVGEDMLPAIEGWSWYDATIKAQQALQRAGGGE